MYRDDDDRGLRIDDSSDEDATSTTTKNGVNDEKKSETFKDKKITPESKGLDYLSSGSSSKSKKESNLFGDEDTLEEGELKEPMIKNFFKSSLPTQSSTPKKRKTQQQQQGSGGMVDVATNVTDLSEEMEDVSSLKQNQYYTINIMILSRTATTTGHTFTFTTSFRDKTYHGVLTDGSPPIIHNNQIQKRAAAAEKEKGNEDSDEKREITPKPRNPKRSRGDDETKSPLKAQKHRHKSPQLHEISKDNFVRCPHKMCGNRFISITDVNNHLLNSHVDGMAIIKEEIATQTEPFTAECQKCKKLEQELIEKQSMDALFKNVKAPKKESPNSDDDDAAPTLEKETTYPEKDGINKSNAAGAAIINSQSPTLEAVAREARLPTMPSISNQKIEPQQLLQPQLRQDSIPISAASLASAFPGFAGGLPPGVSAGAIPPGLFFNAQFNPNFATNQFLQQAAAAAVAASAAAPPPKPAMSFGATAFPPQSTISPIPSSSKIPPDPNRHKIHELKTEISPASLSSSSVASLPGRSITAGTSGNPLDLLNIRPMQQQQQQRPPPPAVSAPIPQGLPNFLQQQLMFGHMFPGSIRTPGDLNQFSYLNNQQPGLFPPK